MSNTIITNVESGVLYITLNRPDNYNAFNKEMAFALQEVLDQAKENPSIRAVYLTANGKAFCSGQDLKEVSNPTAFDFERVVTEHYNPIVLKIRELPLPVIVAVNGVAAGAGANIALAGDVVVAKESAVFIQAFSKIGLIPDCGGTYTLPRLIGKGKASALMLLAEPIDAAQADSLGMIYKVFDEASFEEESKKIAQHLAQMPTVGLAETKALLNRSMQNDLKAQLEEEAKAQVFCGDTEDFTEGVRAFVEKRKPNFKGK